MERARPGPWFALAALALAAFLTIPAGAQTSGVLPSGAYSPGEVVVEPGETLRIGPSTRLFQPGNITVRGTLLAAGTEGAPAEFNLEVRVLAGGRAEFEQARLWGVNDTALKVYGGEVVLQDVLLEGNDRAALVQGDSVVEARDVVFRDQAGEALSVEDSARVTLDRATFSGNSRGATVYSARAFSVNNSTFTANGQHLVVDLGPWSLPDADITLSHNRFLAPAPSPGGLPSIALRYDPAFVEDAQQTVALRSNRIEGASVGMRIEGRGLVVESVNDTIVDNDVGLFVQQATVGLVGPTLGNERDVDGAGRVTLTDATYLHANVPPPAPVEQGAGWLAWAIGAGLVALLGVAVVVPRALRRPRAPAPVTLPIEEVPPPPPPVAPDLSVALSAVETRILEDILAHPGTAQRAVADRLGYTRQALHYHVKKLEARGLVEKTVEGRETRCTVPPDVALAVKTRTGSHEKA